MNAIFEVSHTSGVILQKARGFSRISEHPKKLGSGHESLIEGTQHCPLITKYTKLGFPPPGGSIFLNSITWTKTALASQMILHSTFFKKDGHKMMLFIQFSIFKIYSKWIKANSKILFQN